MLEEIDEDDEEGGDDVEETSDDKMVDVQTDLSSGMGDASMPLEGTVAAAVDKEEHGQVIAEKLHNLALDQEIEVSSPLKKPVASPLKKQQSTNCLHEAQLPDQADPKAILETLEVRSLHWHWAFVVDCGRIWLISGIIVCYLSVGVTTRANLISAFQHVTSR